MSTTTFGEMLANAPTGDFGKTLLDPGDYSLQISEARANKDNGIGLDLTVTEGPYAGTVAGTYWSAKEKALGILRQNAGACGLDDAFFQSISHMPITAALEAIASALKGRAVKGTLEHNTYNNVTRNQFKIGAIQVVSAPPLPAIGGIPAAAVPAAPVAAAPAAPVAPVAPVAAAPAAPVAAPVAPIAPVAVVPSPVASAPVTEAPVAPVAPTAPVVAAAPAAPVAPVAPAADPATPPAAPAVTADDPGF